MWIIVHFHNNTGKVANNPLTSRGLSDKGEKSPLATLPDPR